MSYTIYSGESSEGIILENKSMIVLDGGMADSTTVNSDGWLHVSSGGTANSTTVSSGGWLHVSSGGTANSTTVFYRGWLDIFSGGMANVASIYEGGIDIYSGGTVNSATIHAGGILIESGGTADNTVNFSGTMDVYGTANNTTLNPYGHMYISSGGVANVTSIYEGYIHISSGGTADSITIDSGGWLYLSSGGTARNVVASRGAYLSFDVASDTYIQGTSDGLAFETKNAILSGFTVDEHVRLHVSSGGTVNDTTVSSGGFFVVNSGGTANNTVNFSGTMYVYGSANSTTVNSGRLDVYSGGTANNITVNSGGAFTVFSSGGTANGTTINSGGHMEVHSGGTANSTTVNSGGAFTVFSSGGTANGVTVNSGGSFTVYSGGTAKMIRENGGTVNVSNGAEATFVANVISGQSVSSDQVMTVHSGTTANSTSIKYMGFLDVYSGGTANITTVNSEAYYRVYSGGTANSTTILSGGRMGVLSGGTANNITVNSRGYLSVNSGGTANGITVTPGAEFFPCGTITDITVSSGGQMEICSGGTANGITVNSGRLDVRSGGTANSATIDSGSWLHIYSGGSARNIVAFHGVTLRFAVASDTYVQGTSDGRSFEMKDAVLSGFATDNYVILDVSSGGVATDLIMAGGYLRVSGGGTVNSTTMSDATIEIQGGTANRTQLNAYGLLLVSSGGTAKDTAVNSGGALHVVIGGSADNATVNSGGSLRVFSGGKADGITVDADARLYVSSGGTATNIATVSDAFLNLNIIVAPGTCFSEKTDSSGLVIQDGKASGGTIESRHAIEVWSGGTMNDMTLNSRCSLYVSSGGLVDGTIVNDASTLTVYSGGTAANVVWTPFVGKLILYSGAHVTFAGQHSGIYYGNDYGLISHAMGMQSVSISYKDSMYVMSGGVAEDTTVRHDMGEMFVWSGGTASHTTLDTGKLSVSSGGTANDITVNSYGTLRVFSGGTAHGVSWTPCEGLIETEDGASVTYASHYSGIYYGASRQLISHAARIDSMILSSACMYVMSGGTANAATVNNYLGSMFVWSDGTANDTILAGGYLFISSGGTANGTTVSSGGWARVSSGGMANSTTVNRSGAMHVSGGTANETVLNFANPFRVFRSGTANKTTLNMTTMEIYTGAANSTTVNAGGRLVVYNSGMVNQTVLKSGAYCSGVYYSGGILNVSSGGTANSTTVEEQGHFNISSGGAANDTIVDANGRMDVIGGTAGNTRINSFGGLAVYSSGTATDIMADGGEIDVSTDGTTNNVTLNSSAIFHIGAEGTANGTTVNSGCKFFVSSGGTANGTTVNSDGSLWVSSGGTANSTTVNSGGILNLNESGCVATEIRENGGCVSVRSNCYDSVSFASNTFSGVVLSGSYVDYFDWYGEQWTTLSRTSATVHSGTTACATEVNGGEMFVYSGGRAIGTTLSGTVTRHEAPGILAVSGGTVTETTVNSLGEVNVFSGGTADGSLVNSGGSLYVSSGGTATNTRINADGYFHVESGGVADSVVVADFGVGVIDGKLSGQVSVEKDGYLFLNQNSVFDFDLTRTSIGASALVNGFSRITGDASYTITVGADQPIGVYQLARNVYEFDKTVSVMDASGAVLGSLAIDRPVNIGNVSYSLSLIDSSLFLAIREPGPDRIAPAVFSVTQSHGDPTLRPVTVTAEFADDVALKSALYRVGENGAWTDYAGGVVVTENTTVYFKAVDASGNESEVVSHSVTNIGKNARDPVYVYLDFDGEQTSYHNRELNLSLSVAVADPGYSDSRKRIIQSELTEMYAADGVVFTLTRPDNAEYSTLYFGKSDAFADYGEYFGISETLDRCNRVGNDNAFVLLDDSCSIEQILSVAGTALDHILGYTCSPKDELQLRDYAVNSCLLSTKWNQTGPYNKYCPMDYETGYRCVAGCTPIEEAQIVYYWIENGMLDFSLALEDTDYAWAADAPVDADPENAVKYGYLSFAETNELLSNFKLGNIDSIAALCFAAGILDHAGYGSSQTMAGHGEFFSRSGIHDPSCHSNYLSRIANDKPAVDVFGPETEAKEIGEIGWEILIRDLLAGRPASGVCAPTDVAHAIVIDGYNSSTGEFHLNFGWGGLSNGWYSRESVIKVCKFLTVSVGVTPEITPDLTVSDLSLEQDAVKQGNDVVIHLSLSNSGNVKSSGSMAYVYCGETLLSSQVLDFLYSGETRVFSLTVDSSELSLGANTITVTVDSPDTEAVLGASLTIEVYESVVSNMQFFTGDFDNGGRALLATQKDGAVRIYSNGAEWGNGLALETGWTVVATGDFNADKKDDFLRVNTEGYVVGEMSQGDGTFAAQVLNLKSAGWSILGTGDFNGNGSDDVLIANPTAASETVGLLGYWESGVTWTLINGYSAEWEMVSCGDFNGDGKCDMLWKNSFVGAGDLTYNAYCTWIVEDPVDWRMVSVANPDEWNFLCSGDFDGDKMNDIAMINDVGVVGIWGVNDGYLSSWSILSAVTSEWTLAGVADFNGDGTDDIAWSNTDTGLTGYWQINDKTLTTWANLATIK